LLHAKFALWLIICLPLLFSPQEVFDQQVSRGRDPAPTYDQAMERDNPAFNNNNEEHEGPNDNSSSSSEGSIHSGPPEYDEALKHEVILSALSER